MKKQGSILLRSIVAGLSIVHLSCSQPSRGPNIVLVSLDTLRADHLKSYGYGKETSPFLDSLVEQGTSFANTISQANWTLPSHVSLFTSLYPGVHRVQRSRDRMGGRLSTMAEMLKKAGYATAAFVGGGVLSRDFGFEQGFDLYADKLWGKRKDRSALRWVKAHRDGPFFLFYHTYDIHFPYRHHPHPRRWAEDRELREIARRLAAGERNFSDEEMEKFILAFTTDREFYRSVGLNRIVPLKEKIDEFVRERWPRMPSYRESLRYLVDAYDGGISFSGRRIERLWTKMMEMGLEKNTILIVTSDHGECFLEHGVLGHPAVLYDEIVRVPLIVVGPGLGEKGRMIEAQVMLIDVLPTVLDMAGLKAPGWLQGRSLLALIEGKVPEAGREAFSDSLEQRAIRTGAKKYIRPAAGGGGELYDLEKDAGERENLASRDEAEGKRLNARLREWRKEEEAERRRLGLEGEPEKVELSADTLQELRALGYLQ